MAIKAIQRISRSTVSCRYVNLLLLILRKAPGGTGDLRAAVTGRSRARGGQDYKPKVCNRYINRTQSISKRWPQTQAPGCSSNCTTARYGTAGAGDAPRRDGAARSSKGDCSREPEVTGPRVWPGTRTGEKTAVNAKKENPASVSASGFDKTRMDANEGRQSIGTNSQLRFPLTFQPRECWQTSEMFSFSNFKVVFLFKE